MPVGGCRGRGERAGAGDRRPWRGARRGASGRRVRQMAEERAVSRLDELRNRIDAIDEQLVALLNARAECALAIGHEKKTAGLDVYQPTREAEVLRHVQHCNM